MLNLILTDKEGFQSERLAQCLYGGAPKGPQLKDLERGADIVVATCNLGANLWERNTVTMSFAPRDNHEARVQFKRERARMYMMEVDRVLDLMASGYSRFLPLTRNVTTYHGSVPKRI
ncbi:DEAD-box ATP-dependent RNA helicase 14 [Tanacetum coccineum]